MAQIWTRMLPTPRSSAAKARSRWVMRRAPVFVGDLAPETSNKYPTLLTNWFFAKVFRNPLLGLRNDRAPRFVPPFVSCKSATIVTDSVTGVSLGYGFVRFTNELDHQRALVDMQGLYCLSRPSAS
ncbi:hypothetical protein R3P38DRAFT_2542028 [Favolaschia claudopus]|uniref:RRM domain-containing protein n=1 Tax=Favolaschia claudopus TaxID=2862362 RepID=A0AAW0ATF0_9AGAR